MKNIIALFAVAVLVSSCASYRVSIGKEIAEQHAKNKPSQQIFMDPPSYQETFDTGHPALETFDTAMLWMNKRFVSARNVIQYSNRDAGMITGKAIEQVDGGGEIVDIWYTITLEVKDGKARVSIQNVQPIASDDMSLYYTEKMHDQFDPFVRVLLKDLKAEVLKEKETW